MEMRPRCRGAVSAVGPLSAASSGMDKRSSDSSKPAPVVYAQEALDRAWRSKRRIAAQGKGKPLKQRFMNAFGGRSAVFVDDREFMEETLDNVLRVSTHNEKLLRFQSTWSLDGARKRVFAASGPNFKTSRPARLLV